MEHKLSGWFCHTRVVGIARLVRMEHNSTGRTRPSLHYSAGKRPIKRALPATKLGSTFSPPAGWPEQSFRYLLSTRIEVNKIVELSPE